MRLLRLVVAALILAVAAIAWAQRRESIPILGVLRTSSFVANDPSTEALKRALREHGYVEGQNIKIVRRFAEGQLDRLPQLAQDLVELEVDVDSRTNHAAVRAAKQATTTIPIVMVLYDYDPVASGLIQSLSRPGGNVTGIFSLQPELGGKRLELLKETLPGLSPRRGLARYKQPRRRSRDWRPPPARSACSSSPSKCSLQTSSRARSHPLEARAALPSFSTLP